MATTKQGLILERSGDGLVRRVICPRPVVSDQLTMEDGTYNWPGMLVRVADRLMKGDTSLGHSSNSWKVEVNGNAAEVFDSRPINEHRLLGRFIRTEADLVLEMPVDDKTLPVNRKDWMGFSLTVLGMLESR